MSVNSQTKVLTIFGLLFSFMIFGCGFNTPPDMQQEIRKFFYENQTESADLFVDWADKNLSEYSARRIYNALLEEGKYHAGIGHPNAISVISFAARNWAHAKGLVYQERDWMELQDEAVENIRSQPGELQLWPTDSNN